MKSVFIVTLFFALSAALAQPSANRYSTGVTIVSGHREGCPVIIGGVASGSPADQAGVRTGDFIRDINGIGVNSLGDASRALGNSATPVEFSLERGGVVHHFKVQRLPFETILQHEALTLTPKGIIVPNDMSNDKMRAIDSFDGSRITASIFPLHYPPNPDLYYAGFEVFLLDGGSTFAVGGIVDNGPAAKAGMYYLDAIVTINGVSLQGKSQKQIEQLLTSNRPTTSTFVIERLGERRIFSVNLAQASALLKSNDKQMVNGAIIPANVPKELVSCFADRRP